MREQSGVKSFLQNLIYSLKAVSELSSFIVFLSIFLILFIPGFLVIFKILGLGAFLTERLVYTSSAFKIFIGEVTFVISFLLIIFSLGALFCNKLSCQWGRCSYREGISTKIRFVYR